MKVLHFDFIIMLGRIQGWFVLDGPIKEYYLYSHCYCCLFFSPSYFDWLIGTESLGGLIVIMADIFLCISISTLLARNA